MISQKEQEAISLLVIGLDNSGKTTLVKQCKRLEKDALEYYTSTPFLNIEKVNLSYLHKTCVIYDVSGQGRYRE